MADEIFTAVLFTVRATRFALPAGDVRAVLPVPALVRPPNAPAALAGFLDLAGQPVPVVSLARLFELLNPDVVRLDDHVLVVPEPAVPAGRAGLLVDRVDDVVRLAHDAVEPIGEAESYAGTVRGAVSVAGTRVLVTDRGRILGARERDRLAALARTEEARRAALAPS